jgi:hypothetical protein
MAEHSWFLAVCAMAESGVVPVLRAAVVDSVRGCCYRNNGASRRRDPAGGSCTRLTNRSIRLKMILAKDVLGFPFLLLGRHLIIDHRP